MIVKEANVYVVETGSFRPIIVELVTNEGITGIGEGAVGFGVGCYAAGKMMEDLAKCFVIGKDPANISSIWNDFYYDTFWGKGAGAIFYAAVSAIEQALWDIKGKVLGVPVYQLLGGKQRDELRVYANDWSHSCATAEDYAVRASEVVADGFDAIKMYPLGQVDPVRHINVHLKNREITKENYKRCIKAVKLTREAIGPDIDLMVDVTAEGTTDVMTKIGIEIEQYNPFWYEEAMDAFDVDAYASVKAKVNIPIATGERLYTRYGFRRLLEIRAVDIVQPDPGTCGGIMELWRIAAMAETYNMRVAPHNCGGPVLTAAAVQLSACLTNFVIQEVFPYRPEIHYDIVENPLEYQIKNGRMKVPTEPGLGVALNHKTVDPFRVAHITLD
ncbi:MAG: mandelate racemase/muconate lactonizing enzyme family protein [Sedimentibacter sp.]|nr:mandelate racemase/muconate lactonizing enzyme family protein [Sedimentibacter sp.]